VRKLENLLERDFLLSEGQSLLHLSMVPDHDDSSANASAGPDAWNYRSAKACAMETFDRRFLETLLRFAEGNVSLAARLAGKERRDLGRLLRKYAIAPQAFRSEG